MDHAKLAKMQQSVRIARRRTLKKSENSSVHLRHTQRLLTSPSPCISPDSHYLSLRHTSIRRIHPGAKEFLTNLLFSPHTRGKGTPRRKVKKVHRTADADDKKLQATLKKLNVQPVQGIEEVNMFKEDGNVIHFGAPRVHGSVPSNTFALYGHGEEKELTELVPGILNQLGPDSLASLRKLAESYQNMQKAQGQKDDEEDDIPDLVEGENFESKVE
ncbi:Nascent polypeptide-associated complex subunit beta [Penicillium oxalicum]|uniref:Nascent polypeptide-associated complex subunit beta n=1 Tax=Penicillium oxalicum TaxID=69781 RepID=UPI0020B8E360|nr:Nascent polypeptide-associated complex subunit beta [Penicillium oxalicum]KAI2787206.1 Nascent polypeptide-associated complex subunit beta [Penicillium oxalicum]